MSTNFTEKFAPSIVSVLGCHDRVIFKGHLPFGRDEHLERLGRWLSQNAPHGFPAFRREAIADSRRSREGSGRRGRRSLSAPPRPAQEGETRPGPPPQMPAARGPGHRAPGHGNLPHRQTPTWSGPAAPGLRTQPQRVLYYYFLDPEFGLMHVRLQTWFPYTVQVYVNGHEWLARQMLHKKLGFVQHDNAFTELDKPVVAQRLADRFPKLPWVKILNRWVRRVNPLLGRSWLGKADYYWVIDQAEYSTDVLFQSRAKLAELYPRLLQHALLCFSAQDILTFLGRRLHPRFDGEVLTDCKMDRLPGARIKHRMKNNWLKMYDKFGQILRIETVINQPREFKVRRYRLRAGQHHMRWCPMNKGVANFYRYHAVARAANAQLPQRARRGRCPLCHGQASGPRQQTGPVWLASASRSESAPSRRAASLPRRPPWRLAPERLPQSRPGPGAFRLRNGFRRGKAASQSSRLSSASTAAHSWSDRQGPS